MEVENKDISRLIVDWLVTMGYPVRDKPATAVRTMFLWEAAKWRMAPWELERLINQTFVPPRGRTLDPTPQWRSLAATD